MNGIFKKHEVAIVGLKDREGNYYACNTFIRDGESDEVITRLIRGKEVEAKHVEVYPYTTFSSFSNFDLSKYEFVFLKVALAMSEEEYKNLNTTWIGYYQFKGRDVTLIEEIECPWEYGLDIYNKSESAKSGIKYALCTWQSRLKFNNDNEFELFLGFWDKKEIALTKHNIERLPELLKYAISDISLSEMSYGVKAFKFVRKELDDYVRKLDKQSAINFVNGTSYSEIKKVPEKFLDKEFFEELIEKDAESGERDYVFFLDYMSDSVIEEYGADELFEQCAKQFFYLNLDNDEDYQYNLNNGFYYSDNIDEEFVERYDSDYEDIDSDYDYEDDFDYMTLDDREEETKSVKRLLPALTEKSLPLLRTLALEKIIPHLNEDMRAKLQLQG